MNESNTENAQKQESNDAYYSMSEVERLTEIAARQLIMLMKRTDSSRRAVRKSEELLRRQYENTRALSNHNDDFFSRAESSEQHSSIRRCRYRTTRGNTSIDLAFLDSNEAKISSSYTSLNQQYEELGASNGWNENEKKSTIAEKNEKSFSTSPSLS